MKRRTFLGIGLTGLLSSFSFARSAKAEQVIDLDQVLKYKPEFKVESMSTDEFEHHVTEGWSTAYYKTDTTGFVPCKVNLKLTAYFLSPSLLRKSGEDTDNPVTMGYSILGDNVPKNIPTYDLHFKIGKHQVVYVNQFANGGYKCIRVIKDEIITYR